ncbi:Ubiquitin-like modifier-activating enzyme 6 [Chamberlinius hualienensis]
MDKLHCQMMDDLKYSRQRYVLGKGAMKKLSCSSIYLRGFGALGVEIAKNLILTGVKRLAIHDCKIASTGDSSYNFFLNKSTVNKDNRVIGSLQEMTEMNPTVQIDALTNPCVDHATLKEFQCIILTETAIKEQIAINEFCRQQTPPIKFISADCLGILCYSFCDYGSEHIVNDVDGEVPKELFINQINMEENYIIVKLLENQKHDIDVGDLISFSNITGTSCLNDDHHSVIAATPSSFKINHYHNDQCFTSLTGGICKKEKRPISVKFESLEKQLNCPKLVETSDTFEDTFNCHLSLLSLHQYFRNYQTLPYHWSSSDLDTFQELSMEVAAQLDKQEIYNSRLVNLIGCTAAGTFTPLAAFMGGVVSQEVLKAVTNVYIPIHQWFYYNAAEIVREADGVSIKETDDFVNSFLSTHLRERLKLAKVFLVGCGAIGCEVIKNLALLNVGGSSEMTVTDHDLVKKSNLTRQFLFRSSSIQKSKSLIAAEAVKQFCPTINIRPLNLKVCQDTQEYFNDQFFNDHDIIIGALDNTEGRQYLDRRCIDNCRPYLDSGTFGNKGHVQVILPHMTESYASQSDPVDDEIPYCTLKSFPATISHTIQWARDKFDSLFFTKPNMVMKFEHSRNTWLEQIKKLDNGSLLEEEKITIINVIGWLSKSLKHVPSDWSQCLVMARLKFEKYFNHKARQLLHKFPLDATLEDEGLFWNFPRRPPKPIDFNMENNLHFLYIISTAKLFAATWQVLPSTWNISKEYVTETLSSCAVPDFIPDDSKMVETDEKARISADTPVLDFNKAVSFLRCLTEKEALSVSPQEFQKDDEHDGHMDFIISTSNLRAIMYGIEPKDNDEIRKLAGRIIPAIITTTSAVAALLTIELLKVLNKCSLEEYKNCFINLALTSFVIAEPAAAPIHLFSNGLRYTLWDKLEVQGHINFTIKDFITTVKKRYGGSVDTIIQDTKIIYMSFIPKYRKTLNKRMLDVITLPTDGLAINLFIDSGDSEDISSPSIRYYIK